MVDKVPVSDLCNELGIQPSLFYFTGSDKPSRTSLRH